MPPTFFRRQRDAMLFATADARAPMNIFARRPADGPRPQAAPVFVVNPVHVSAVTVRC